MTPERRTTRSRSASSVRSHTAGQDALHETPKSAPMALKQQGPVRLFFDQPVSFWIWLRRKIAAIYTVYSYTFVFNLMDWWEQLLMHLVLWVAVGLAAWGIYHQGTALVLLICSLAKYIGYGRAK